MAHDGQVTQPQPTGRPNARLRQSVRDMVLSMAVVIAVVVAILVVTHRPAPEAVKAVDPTMTITAAGMQAPFPILVPTGLPAGWTLTSARWQPTAESGDAPVLHLGYVTPSGQYAQVQETASASTRFLAASTDKGRSSGERSVGDAMWQEWSADGRRSLVELGPPRTIVVSGTGDWSEVASLAASLRAPSAG